LPGLTAPPDQVGSLPVCPRARTLGQETDRTPALTLPPEKQCNSEAGVYEYGDASGCGQRAGQCRVRVVDSR
jgi:hypothetical protein